MTLGRCCTRTRQRQCVGYRRHCRAENDLAGPCHPANGKRIELLGKHTAYCTSRSAYSDTDNSESAARVCPMLLLDHWGKKKPSTPGLNFFFFACATPYAEMDDQLQKLKSSAAKTAQRASASRIELGGRRACDTAFSARMALRAAAWWSRSTVFKFEISARMNISDSDLYPWPDIPRLNRRSLKYERPF